jgi:lauroyl/myristoyl acyltransferase
VLSLSKPSGGFRIMADLRNRGVVEETPIDALALRTAIQRLRGGGNVLTAADWPLPGSEHERLQFFGKPAPVPNSHVRLAMSSNAVMLPMVCRWTPEQGYFIKTAPHMELELSGDRAADLRHNAQRVLAVFERWIAETPDQWLMYYRVWPDQSPVQQG